MSPFGDRPGESVPSVAVIGGGLAGSVFAARLAASGQAVTLIEKDNFPRDKLCGEFLSPESAQILDQVGALEPLVAANAPRMNQATFSSASGRTATFSLPGPGWGVSRCRLDALLFERACALGATPLHGEVQQVHEESDGRHRVQVQTEEGLQTQHFRHVVGAFGRHSRLDRALGRQTPGKNQWVGIKRHHRLVGPEPALTGRVEIHVFGGGYCGMNFVEGDRVNVCALLRADWIRKRGFKKGAWFGAMAEANSVLAERLGALEPIPGSRELTVSGIDFRRLEPARSGMPLLGDASAMIAPLAGDGQGMALTSACMLADAISHHGWERALQLWPDLYRRRFASRLRLGRVLQAALLHPLGSESLVRAVKAWPGLGALLARHTRDPIANSPTKPKALPAGS